MRGEGAYDGVFGMWYGKGPGVDRCGDVFRHANAAGTSEHGGVLVLMGDDHGAESSTVPHQSEFALVDAMMPMLNPAGVQEILDYGQLGIAMSRYSGCWVGLKCVHDTVESTTIIDGSLDRLAIAVPQDFKMPEGGLNIRPRDDRFEQERRLHHLQALRRGGLCPRQSDRPPRLRRRPGSEDRHHQRPARAISTCGRRSTSSASTRSRRAEARPAAAEDRPGVAARSAHRRRLCRRARPSDRASRRSARCSRRSCASSCATARHPPVVIGKKDEAGNHLFPAFGTLEPNQIALAIGERLLKREPNPRLEERMAEIRAVMAGLSNAARSRQPHPLFLRRLPAQFIDRRARRRPRLCRDRLPLDGAVHSGAPYGRGDPYGWRGRQLDRRGAVLDAQARVPESRRRHL